jgi:hypothetical protein
MSFQSRKRLFLAAAALVAAAVLMIGTFVALQVRSVVAGPDAAAPAAAPTPVGHNWAEVEGHGTGTGLWWLGTIANQALELRVNGARALRLEPSGDIYTGPNLIGGYSGNSVTAGAVGAAIGGGGASGNTNRVTDNSGVVGGGVNNQAGDNTGTTTDRTCATVGGGFTNTASGMRATVGGGESNTASGYAATVAGGQNNTSANWATVGGGQYNTADGYSATVGGGQGNHAGGSWATVPGGYDNVAWGNYSFAAGYNAQTTGPGSFVWADSTGAVIGSYYPNQFLARASGGTTFYSNADATVGVALYSNDGSWSSFSSRDVKDNFTPVDGQQVLASLANVPITTWNYKAQDPSIRHMGPMAQDFSAAFGLGEDNLHISTVDADGVALAAIHGLYQLSQEQAERIEALEAENADLQGRLGDLEARVTALEGGAGVSGSSTAPLSSAMPAGWLLLGGLVVGGLVVVQRRRAGGRS